MTGPGKVLRITPCQPAVASPGMQGDRRDHRQHAANLGRRCVPGTPGPGLLPPARSLYGRGLFIAGLLAGTWGIAPSPAILGRTAWFQAALTTGAAGPAS